MFEMCEELSGKCNHRKIKSPLQLIIQSASSVEVVSITAHLELFIQSREDRDLWEL